MPSSWWSMILGGIMFDDLHCNICIPFKIEEQPFEAVGFLKKGEECVFVLEAIRRCRNLFGHDDLDLLYRNLKNLPEQLQQFSLIIPHPPLGFSTQKCCIKLYFGRDGDWKQVWCYFDSRCFRGYVLVRRRFA